MKENQEISHKKVEYQYQDSIKNFKSSSMVDDGGKIGDLFDSTKKENQQVLSCDDDTQGEYQHQDSIKKFRSLSMVDDEDKRVNLFVESEKLGLSGREKLKRHWREVGGRVFVPDRWGHEGSLREWMDCSSFDNILAPKGLKSAREALMSQGKRARSGSTSRMLEIRSS
nr:protein BIC1-like [Solanum lycopersicum]